MKLKKPVCRDHDHYEECRTQEPVCQNGASGKPKHKGNAVLFEWRIKSRKIDLREAPTVDEIGANQR